MLCECVDVLGGFFVVGLVIDGWVVEGMFLIEVWV